MKKVKYLIAGACIAFTILVWSGCCDCPGDCTTLSSVTVPVRPQQTDNWCWIACSVMIHEFFGGSITQCDLANARLGRTDCCDNEGDASCPKTDDCNTPGNTKAAIESLGYSVTQSDDPLAWNTLRKKIYCSSKPMVFGDGAAAGGVGHVRVIYGYVTVAGTNYITLSDPWAPCAGSDDLITYEEYSNTAGPGRVHRKTLHSITKL
jgi:hypothetical protein